jgi:hypothetical protein
LQAEATTCILRSIYLVDDLTSDITERPISLHLEAATTGRSKVVPLALILVRSLACVCMCACVRVVRVCVLLTCEMCVSWQASTPMPVAQALQKLDAQPIVRKLIAEAARP